MSIDAALFVCALPQRQIKQCFYKESSVRCSPTQTNPNWPWSCSITDSLVQDSPSGLLAVFSLQECSACATKWIVWKLLSRHQGRFGVWFDKRLLLCLNSFWDESLPREEEKNRFAHHVLCSGELGCRFSFDMELFLKLC